MHQASGGLNISEFAHQQGAIFSGRLTEETRRERNADENPADYAFEYNRDTGDIKLSVLKWSGNAGYVHQTLSKADRPDIRAKLEVILPSIIGLGFGFSKEKSHASDETRKRWQAVKAFGDFLKQIEQSGLNDALLERAISNYEQVAGEPLHGHEDEDAEAWLSRMLGQT